MEGVVVLSVLYRKFHFFTVISCNSSLSSSFPTRAFVVYTRVWNTETDAVSEFVLFLCGFAVISQLSGMGRSWTGSCVMADWSVCLPQAPASAWLFSQRNWLTIVSCSSSGCSLSIDLLIPTTRCSIRVTI